MLKVGHVVTRPGRKLGDAPVDIPVPEELETVPGIPITSREVDFYSREYPLQRQQVEHAADTGGVLMLSAILWAWSTRRCTVVRSLEPRRDSSRLAKGRRLSA